MPNLFTGDVITYNGKEAKEQVLKPAIDMGALADFGIKVVEGVKVKQQVIFLKKLGKLTIIDPGCGQGVTTTQIPRTVKYFEPVDLKAWIKLCWKDVEGTALEDALKTGNEKSDLTGTDVEKVVLDVMEPAVKEDNLRMMFLSDTAIVAGQLTGGANDVKYYNQYDGYFKLIATGVAASKIKYHAITKNAGASYAAQELAAGEARQILRGVYNKQTTLMKQQPKADKVFLVTRAIFENYSEELESNDKLESSWKQMQDGTETLTYRGIPLKIVDVVDTYLEADFNNGTKIDKPHRVILTVKENLQMNYDADPFNPLAMEVWYERKDEEVHNRLKYKGAPIIADEDYLVAAY